VLPPRAREGDARAFAPRLSRVGTATALVAVTALGLVPRLAWFGRYRLAGTDCDGAGYMDVARHLAAGAGFTTGIFKYLYLPPAALPQPDAHWSPLYPLLTAGSFALFGESIAAAKLVPLLLGAAVPALAWLLALSLTGDRRTALLAGLLAALHPTLVTWSLRIETEIGTVALATAALALLPRSGPRANAALGVVTGLAWLMKYQSALLWGAILARRLLLDPPGRRGRDLAAAAAAFALVAAPWALRNQLVFGAPCYTDLCTDIVSAHPGLGGVDRVWASTTMPPAPLGYMLAHAGETLGHVYGNLRGYALRLPPQALGSLLFAPLAVAGIWSQLRRLRAWAPVLVYGALLLGMFSLSTAFDRYQFSLFPPVVVLAAAGAVWALDRAAALGRGAVAARALVGLLLLAALTDQARLGAAKATDRDAPWNPHANFCAAEYLAAAPFIRDHAGPREAVMAAEAYHAGYLFGRPVVNLPFDEPSLRHLCARYGVRYLVVSDRQRDVRLPGWAGGPPAWARPVARWSAPDIARMYDAPAGWVSAVTVYRLAPP
jgi:hypothetical protein